MKLLEISHLKKSYDGIIAVDDLSFRVEAGEVFGLLGPNGAGKTTTMTMVAGLMEPDSGSIFIDGQRFHPGNLELKRTIGVVPQELAIYPHLTASENLDFFGQLYGLRGRHLRLQVDSALEQTGLADHARKPTETFSGGMKRRLNFAVALLHQPGLVILDEPTVGVDPQSRHHLLNSVHQLSQAGTAVVYASHYMEEVEAICHRVVIIDHGRMIACGELDQLLNTLKMDLRLRVSGSTAELTERLKGLTNVEIVSRQTANRSHTTYSGSVDVLSNGDATIVINPNSRNGRSGLTESLSRVIQILDESHIELHSVDTQDSNLERLFLKLTGHSLRD